MSKLVAGLIPAGTACPFLDKCKFKVHTCPGSDNGVKSTAFSCAAARLFDMIKEDNSGFDQAAKAIVEKPKPIQPFGDEVVILDDDGYTD